MANPVQVPPDLYPHPTGGGTCGYDYVYRLNALRQVANGTSTIADWDHSERTHRRWLQRAHPHRMTGGHEASNMKNEHLMLLIAMRMAYPKATADEIRTFILTHASAGNVRLYSRQDISRAEIELGITCKVGSTTAYQALTPVNTLKRRMFWSLNYPLGVANVPR